MARSKSSTYTPVAEAAAKVRREIKDRWGYTGRDVSVRSENYAGGSAIRLTAKVPGVPLSELKDLASRMAEEIHRDHMTHEILSGVGNRYVTSSWDSDLLWSVTELLVERVRAMGDDIEHPRGVEVIEVTDRVEIRYRNTDNSWVVYVDDESWGYTYGPGSTADVLAAALLETEEDAEEIAREWGNGRRTA